MRMDCGWVADGLRRMGCMIPEPVHAAAGWLRACNEEMIM